MKSSTCVGLYSRPMQSQSRHLIRRPLRPPSAILIRPQMILTMTDFDLQSPAVILISLTVTLSALRDIDDVTSMTSSHMTVSSLDPTSVLDILQTISPTGKTVPISNRG